VIALLGAALGGVVEPLQECRRRSRPAPMAGVVALRNMVGWPMEDRNVLSRHSSLGREQAAPGIHSVVGMVADGSWCVFQVARDTGAHSQCLRGR
jgi:hypothetical protein